MARRLWLGVAIGLGLLLLLDAALVRAGMAPGVIPRLGSAGWITSRAAGVTALVALTLDVSFGLFVSTGAADRWLPRARTVDTHRWLSSVTLALVAVHAAALLLDRVVPFDLLDLLVPFLSGYRPAAVALGVLAAQGALLVHLSFSLRRRLGARAWRRLHALSFPVFVAAVGHGLLAGSDRDDPVLRGLHVAAAASVGALALLRLLSTAARRRRAAAADGCRSRSGSEER